MLSETLAGVIVGGVIAVIPTLISALGEHRRWKIDKKLEILRAQRMELVKRSSEMLPKFREGIKFGNYDIEMLSDFIALMPKPVTEKFRDWMGNEAKNVLGAKFVLMDISLGVNEALREIDEKIDKIVR